MGMHKDEHTWILPASPSGGRITENIYYENKARSDQNGANPIYALISFGRGLVLIDHKVSQEYAHEGDT